MMSVKRAVPHCSQTAFTGMVRMAKAMDLSSFPSTRVTYRSFKAQSLGDTPFGPMLVSVTLLAKPPYANKELHVVNPFSYLYTAHSTAGGFFDLIQAKVKSTPPSVEKPWRLVMYADEVVPGNQLATRHARKVRVIYFSFLELHPHLSNENSWCPLVAEPSDGLKNIHSGISQVFAKVTKLFSGDTFEFRCGIHLPGPEGSGVSNRLFAVLSMLLQDGGAHKLVWGCNGDAGTKLCMLCLNLIAELSGLVDVDGSDILVCNLCQEAQLQFATDADIRGSISRLERYKVIESKGDFALWQQAIGFNYLEHGMLTDKSLEDIVFPASQYCHDWMHCIFAGGIFNVVIFLCLMAAKEEATNVWEILHGYTLKFTWPKAVNFCPDKNDNLSKARVKAHVKAKLFKCTASDGLSLLPVVALFAQGVLKLIPGINLAALDAFILLADVVDVLCAVPLGVVTAACLRDRIRAFLQACEAAGWRPHFIPKFHWLIHLANALERWGILPTCWVHERKHKVVKRYADDIHNTKTYSTSVISEAISHQLCEVCEASAFDLSPGLVNPSTAKAKARTFVLRSLELPAGPEAAVMTSTAVRLTTGALCCKTDAILIRANDDVNFVAGQLWLLFSVEDLAVALVSLWDFESYDRHQGKAIWRMVDRPALLNFDDILCSVIWSETSPGIAVTLVPYQYRGLEAVVE